MAAKIDWSKKQPIDTMADNMSKKIIQNWLALAEYDLETASRVFKRTQELFYG